LEVEQRTQTNHSYGKAKAMSTKRQNSSVGSTGTKMTASVHEYSRNQQSIPQATMRGSTTPNNDIWSSAIKYSDSLGSTAATTRANSSRVETDRKQTFDSKGTKAVFEALLAIRHGVTQQAIHTVDEICRLESYVSELSSGPDWKQVLIDLIGVLEQSGDKLPLPVLHEKRVIEGLLGGQELPGRNRRDYATVARTYCKSSKLDAEGNLSWVVRAKGAKTDWGTFEIESDADQAIQHLQSPAVSLMRGISLRSPAKGGGRLCRQ
jgi:hypothetical protein